MLPTESKLGLTGLSPVPPPARGPWVPNDQSPFWLECIKRWGWSQEPVRHPTNRLLEGGSQNRDSERPVVLRYPRKRLVCQDSEICLQAP